MMVNNIPNLLKEKGITRYGLWKLMGNNEGDRGLIYQRLLNEGAETRPIPPTTQWGTIKRVAQALNVDVKDLERSVPNGQAGV